MKTIIIGGSAGGASAAARLRRLDEDADIVLLERGAYISFANCGLPYFIGGEIARKSSLILQTPESFRSRFRIDVRIRHEALGLDTERKTVTVLDRESNREYRETYDKLILSPGAEPWRPSLSGIDDPRVFTLRNIPDAFRIREYIERNTPRTAVVIGGGFIGLEMAENLARAGLSVTVVEAAEHVIGALDYEMACKVHRYLRQKGIALRLNHGVKAFHPGAKTVAVELEDGYKADADMVLLSIGVRPDSALAAQAGLAVNPRGAIVVDDRLRTSNQDIYAIGDAVQINEFVSRKPTYIPLAGPANKQGRMAADNICGLNRVYNGTQGSSILKLFDMVAACTGLQEGAAQKADIDYDKVYLLSASHASYYPGSSSMNMKVLFEKPSGRILGAQIVGFDGVDKRCDVLAAAIRAGMGASDLAELELCYAPPFSSAKDPVNMAGFAIENLLTGKLKQYHWHDVDSLPRDGSVTLLDVRTPSEYAAGAIEGAVNFPLDTLREHIGQLDRTKPVYVNCRSGQRSYLACRILAQKGFNCHNLSGGYDLYVSVQENRQSESAQNR